MASTILRLGLYLLLVVFSLYVIETAFENSVIAEFVDASLLQRAMGLGVLLLGAGAVLRILERAASKIPANRCAVCRTPVTKGAIYCRAHLRSILAEEDEKTHHTRR
jgi:hypothetical protein